ncbi:MAG: YicC family protein [Bacteroidetes bacterium]|nr:YicC family protein [Bacteroidota bacterium]MBT3748654.1 YicC family protein [Bacteroidota bacterium]MBT4401506.1 YicC family protein [Bacteroidota bacterium]MBT4411154.1 YicC family protein [Bacteroidota bacterium]MBT7093222.1 YicC family protein [Bacteroidota bacterium]
MTGYGKAGCELSTKIISIEIKTLNSKQTDIYTKLPGIYREAETELRNVLARKLERGKIEVAIWYEITEVERKTVINQSVLLDYLEQLNGLNEQIKVPDNDVLIPIAMRLPDILTIHKQEFDPEEWAQVMKAIYEAIDHLKQFREQEGRNLEVDIKNRINNIRELIPEIEKYEAGRIERTRERLDTNLVQHIGQDKIDSNRFEQEILYFIEKLDITEEKVRLHSHCNYFLETINEEGPVGKKLGFISQEIGREINTIGSKANDKDMQKLVIQMKDELEKIKEQTLNVL